MDENIYLAIKLPEIIHEIMISTIGQVNFDADEGDETPVPQVTSTKSFPRIRFCSGFCGSLRAYMTNNNYHTVQGSGDQK